MSNSAEASRVLLENLQEDMRAGKYPEVDKIIEENKGRWRSPMSNEYRPTGHLRFIDRLEPETGRILKILQQEWEPVAHIADVVKLSWPVQNEWRDVPSVDANGNPK